MKVRFGVILMLVLLVGGACFAQTDHKIETTLNYSYMRFNPENSNTIKSFSLNGGGGDIAFFLTNMIAIKGEFQGYASQSRVFTVPPANCIPPDVQQVRPAAVAVGCTGSVQGNLFTYNVGPELKLRHEHFEPFVEVLFGGAHSQIYGNLKKDCPSCIFTKSPSNNAFDFAIGGGLDVPVNHMIAIRVAQFDYVLTRFGNGFTSGNQNQSNFRFQAGVQFRF